ncbi:hypothetical protein Hte_010230 [Hypoxylon texense]
METDFLLWFAPVYAISSFEDLTAHDPTTIPQNFPTSRGEIRTKGNPSPGATRDYSKIKKAIEGIRMGGIGSLPRLDRPGFSILLFAGQVIPQSVRDWWHEYRGALKNAEKENIGNDEISEHVEMAGWGVEEAERRHKAEASLGTQLALAYAVHKSFIFLRVPLTAAITPKVVKVLRSWGWNIGKRQSKR